MTVNSISQQRMKRKLKFFNFRFFLLIEIFSLYTKIELNYFVKIIIFVTIIINTKGKE